MVVWDFFHQEYDDVVQIHKSCGSVDFEKKAGKTQTLNVTSITCNLGRLGIGKYTLQLSVWVS